MNSMKVESLGSAAASPSDEQYEESNESPIGCNQLPDVTSKVVASAEDFNNVSYINVQSPEVTSHTTENIRLLEEDKDGAKDNITNIRDGDVTGGLKNMSVKLSEAFVNGSAKEDWIKQKAKVAEEAIAGWEKAENEVVGLRKQLEALTLLNSALEDRVTHLDGALKECVRQLRQTREEQEQNIHDAVVKKTQHLESAKIELENQLIELQSKLDASKAESPSSIDHDFCQKVQNLEKENMALKHELLAQSQELEIRTIERDLSTQAAEMASKQHLESINKVAKLEAECRRLKSMACKPSLVNDHKSITSTSFCAESLIDSRSNNGERLNAVEIELDQFKNEKGRQITSSSVKIDLMDDFLEMERLAALSETKNESFIQDSVDIMNQEIHELKDKLEKAKSEKSELEIALMKSEECIEASQLKLREAEIKLEGLLREVENANKSEQIIENQLRSMEEEAQSITARVQLLEAEVEKERATSVEISIMCKELEEYLESKKHEEKLWSIANSYSEMKIKQEDLALAAGKLAECQQTIASLGNQLNSLVTLEDFLSDTASIPEFSATANRPSLINRTGGEIKKLYSNGTHSPERDSSSSKLDKERGVVNQN